MKKERELTIEEIVLIFPVIWNSLTFEQKQIIRLKISQSTREMAKKRLDNINKIWELI